MNFRIIDTSAGPLLLYRDQNKEAQPRLVARIDTAEDTIIQITQDYPFLDTESVQGIIRTMTQENAERLAAELVNSFGA